MATRKKGGQRLMELAEKSGARSRARKAQVAKKLKEQVKRNFRAGSKFRAGSPKGSKTTHGSTTITYKPKPSPHLSATKKVAKKAAPKSVAKKAAPKAVAKKATPKKKSLTPAQKLANDQRRKNLRSEIEGRFKGDKLSNPLGMTSLLAKIYGKDIKNMTHLDEAELAGKAALDLGIGVATGGTIKAAGGAKKIGGAVVKGVKATGRGAATGARATGRAVATGAKATGRAAVTGAKATKRAARIARVAAKKADRKLLKAQGLSRQGGKVRKIKEPNPFGKNAAKGSKPKPKAKSGKKNPFAGSAKPKAKGKQLDEHVKARRKSMQQDEHIKARRKARAKATKAKNDPGKLADELAQSKKAIKPINKPYKTPATHPLKSWKAPATKKAKKKAAKKAKKKAAKKGK
jgi:hypothetical protein